MPERDRSPVLVFDLDGTILRVNSFPRWVLYLIGGRIPGLGPGRRARLSLAALWLLFWRKFGRLDHDEMSRRLQNAWRVAAPGRRPPACHRFAAGLRRYVRSNFKPALEMVAEDRLDAVLATAAAANYAAPLGRLLGFWHVLATPCDREAGEPINAGPRKRDRVLEFLATSGWHDRPLVLFTDHIDDLPLMRECCLVCWFGPEKRMVEARAATPATCFAFCRDLSAEAISAIARELAPTPINPSIAGEPQSRREITAS